MLVAFDRERLTAAAAGDLLGDHHAQRGVNPGAQIFQVRSRLSPGSRRRFVHVDVIAAQVRSEPALQTLKLRRIGLGADIARSSCVDGAGGTGTEEAVHVLSSARLLEHAGDDLLLGDGVAESTACAGVDACNASGSGQGLPHTSFNRSPGLL